MDLIIKNLFQKLRQIIAVPSDTGVPGSYLHPKKPLSHIRSYVSLKLYLCCNKGQAIVFKKTFPYIVMWTDIEFTNKELFHQENTDLVIDWHYGSLQFIQF
jgi:hypothetical protein